MDCPNTSFRIERVSSTVVQPRCKLVATMALRWPPSCKTVLQKSLRTCVGGNIQWVSKLVDCCGCTWVLRLVFFSWIEKLRCSLSAWWQGGSASSWFSSFVVFICFRAWFRVLWCTRHFHIFWHYSPRCHWVGSRGFASTISPKREHYQVIARQGFYFSKLKNYKYILKVVINMVFYAGFSRPLVFGC